MKPKSNITLSSFISYSAIACKNFRSISFGHLKLEKKKMEQFYQQIKYILCYKCLLVLKARHLSTGPAGHVVSQKNS